jgi:outer membrane protein assembly factor BamB
MRRLIRVAAATAGCVLLIAGAASAQDWPQWRGPNRDGKATGFRAPASWPAALAKKWDVTVGSGVANPSLVGDRLYAIGREGEDEVIRCLNATTGDEIWKKSYAAAPATGAGAGPGGMFIGPRSTPTVAGGRVVTLSVSGLLTCFDAANGDVKWRKDEFVGQVPSFFTSSSPIVVDGLCIAQLGRGGGGRGRRGGGEGAAPPAGGAMVAYDLATGDEKWRAPQGSPSYGSPVVMTIDGMKIIVAPSETSMVAVNVADGRAVWQLPYRQGTYNAATPIVDGQNLIIAGPGDGMSGVKLSRQGDEIKEEQLWKSTGNALIFSTPVLKNGALFGISTRDELFAINAEHATGWTNPIVPTAAASALAPPQRQLFAQQQGEGRGRGRGEGRGDARGRGRGRPRSAAGGERPGYGTVVDAGSVLLALTPGGDLVVFQPDAAEFKEVARYKVSTDGDAYSHPIPSGNRIYIKDKDSVSMMAIE